MKRGPEPPIDLTGKVIISAISMETITTCITSDALSEEFSLLLYTRRHTITDAIDATQRTNLTELGMCIFVE